MSEKRIILIDGNSLVYRAFFALPTTLAISSGQVTNAVYGFTSMLIRLLREEKPDIVAVAFDKGISYRVNDYEKYKEHRPPTPDELRSQFPLVKEVLSVLNIPVFESEGFEADDILATLARRAEKEGHTVTVVTGDKDALQLVSLRVKVMTTRKGISDIVVYDKEKVLERYGIPPEAISDFLGLKGDISDNIPGVPGVGEKTASALIKDFGSLEGVLTHVDEISGKKLKESLKAYENEARLSKSLATLHFDVPVEIDFDKYSWGEFEPTKVRELFEALEFHTLLKRLLEQESEETKEVKKEKISLRVVDFKAEKIDSQKALQKILTKLDKENEIGLEIIEDKEEGLKGIILVFNDGSLYYATFEDESRLFSLDEEISKFSVLEGLRTYLESDALLKIVYDGKSKILSFKNEGINLRVLSFDVMIAAYLLNPSKSSYPFEGIIKEFLSYEIEKKEVCRGVCEKAYTLFPLRDILKKTLKEKELFNLFKEIEMPLVSVLSKMEFEGVGLNVDILNELSLQVEKDIERLKKEIWNLAEEEFNINSPQQLASILFEKLKLKCDKKTKRGYSTDYSVLIKLVGVHPIIEKILNYRELVKLKSTYLDVLPRLVNLKTGRLHTFFNQTGTTTGRLSSSNPNLQNIPVRTELGQKIREAFVPANPADMLLVADYSQIELRILAHFSEDENLIQAFEQGMDIHQVTACEVFGVSPHEVTPGMRRIAKAVNFGIVYGISPFGLSEQLQISTEEAKSYIEKYFQRYPKVQEFIRKVIAKAYKEEFVVTLSGRRRYLPELKSSNYTVRNLGERLAINTLIQGSVADIIKIAMVKIDRELEKRNLKSKMILQVHDELVFEVSQEEKEIMVELVKAVMEGVCSLRVRLSVDIAFGENWSAV